MKIIKTRTLLLAGIAGGVGYVLGAKAGHGRYEELRARAEQLRAQADKVAHHEKVQATVSNLAENVKAKADKLPDPVADVVTKAADNVQQTTGASTATTSSSTGSGTGTSGTGTGTTGTGTTGLGTTAGLSTSDLGTTDLGPSDLGTSGFDTPDADAGAAGLDTPLADTSDLDVPPVDLTDDTTIGTAPVTTTGTDSVVGTSDPDEGTGAPSRDV